MGNKKSKLNADTLDRLKRDSKCEYLTIFLLCILVMLLCYAFVVFI